MYTLIRILMCFSVLFICSSFSTKNNQDVVEDGRVVYSFASGKMQCLSEQDQEGNIVILLGSLDENTRVEFSNISNKKNKIILKCMMFVNEKTDLCASWVNAQEVTIVINPITVQKITLTGKSVYKSKKLTVLN